MFDFLDSLVKGILPDEYASMSWTDFPDVIFHTEDLGETSTVILPWEDDDDDD